jgi:hypothetical protein
MSMRLLPFLVLCVGGVLPEGACSPPEAPPPRGFGRNHTPNPDHEVFDAVLSDLLVNPEFYPPVDGAGVSKPQIILADMAVGGISDRQLDHHERAMGTKIPLDIRADLLSRNPKGKRFSLSRYHPAITSVRVRSLDGPLKRSEEFDSEFPYARGFVSPTLPGYSHDGRMALFLFAFGPHDHGTTGIYLLQRAEGQWRVERRFIYFGT